MSNNALKIPTLSQEELTEAELLKDIQQKLEGIDELRGLGDKLQSLWKLDKLERLTYLAELQRLDKLGMLENLQELESLGQLDNLRYLKEISGLKNLHNLDKLDKLNHLMRLKSLNKLEELQALDHLKELSKLEKLGQLDRLSLLNKLDLLKKLEKLDNLSRLEDLRILLQDHADDFAKLDNLKYIERLDNLKKLQALESLDNLRALDSLADLDKLRDLKELSKLEKLNRLNELDHLDKLEGLSSLDRLDKLDELRHLEKLENMQDLSKLDHLKDAKVQTALKGLDKLNFFQENHKKFFFKLFASIFVDFFKVAAITFLLLFVFTKNISRQTFDRLVPYLGFGEADRVNLALSILSHDLSSSDFDRHYKNLELRVKREAAAIFDLSSQKDLDQYRFLENLTSYNYRHESYDLMALAKTELNVWATKTQKKFEDSYSYDIESHSGDLALKEDINHFTQASIFLKQQKFLEAFMETNKIKHRKHFESLSAAHAYAFYMAFMTKPVELKLYLEK